MFAFVAMLVIIVAILLCNDFHFEFSCHGVIIPYFLLMWYNKRWKGGRVVDGTGLENQQVNASQVRILSPPPFLWYNATYGTVAQLVRA